ncbi:MAG TPA: sialidase family protein [Actinomycetota bacterium]|nr:sialidase family protein [Actinomycetota bacterium]
MRMRAIALAAVSAVTLSSSPAQGQQEYVYQPVCEVVTFSPRFAEDRTAFCATAEYLPGTVQPSGNVLVRRSTDGGVTWEPLPSVGLQGLGLSWPVQILVSPSYPDQTAIYVQIVYGPRPGLYRSTDEGETFAWVAPLATTGMLTRPLTAYTAAASIPPPLGAGADAFTYASVEESRPAMLTPPLHRPVAGSPDGAAMFLLPPDFPSSSALVVARGVYEPSPDPETWEWQVSIYRCDVTLTCGEKLAELPPGLDLVDADFLGDGTAYVVVERFGAGTDTQVWRSTDGETFSRWESLDALAPRRDINGNSNVIVDVVDVPGTAGRFFARVSYQVEGESGAPRDRLFRSDDDGVTWRAVASSRRSRGRGYLPWFRRIGPIHAEGDLYMPSPDRLFVLAYEVDARPGSEYMGPFCSVDGGRTWARACR